MCLAIPAASLLVYLLAPAVSLFLLFSLASLPTPAVASLRLPFLLLVYLPTVSLLLLLPTAANLLLLPASLPTPLRVLPILWPYQLQ